MKVHSRSQDSPFVWKKIIGRDLWWAHKLREAESQGISWVEQFVLSRLMAPESAV